MGDICTSSSSSLQAEIDRIILLCSDISRVSSRLRLTYLSNPSFTPDYAKAFRHLLLSMCSHVEGSNLLLETLIENQKTLMQPAPLKKPIRYHYSREQLLKIRQKIPKTLNVDIEKKLKDVIERESNDSTRAGFKSWRDIRTILI